jgi:hypothetical protein
MATDLLYDSLSTNDHRGYRGRHRRTGAVASVVLGLVASLWTPRHSSQPA